MERIRYDDISIHPDATTRQRKIMDEFARCGDGVLITDALANDKRGGLVVMQIMLKTQRDRRFKIRVLSDKWGKPVKQNDKIEWRFHTATRDAFGKKITNAYKKELIRRGRIRDIETWHEAVVDKHGCIEVPFEDAAMLLNTRGVHFESKEPLTRMREIASEPTKCKDGTMRLQHYWLYEEVPSWEYEKLEKKRTRKPKEQQPTNHTSEMAAAVDGSET